MKGQEAVSERHKALGRKHIRISRLCPWWGLVSVQCEEVVDRILLKHPFLHLPDGNSCVAF